MPFHRTVSLIHQGEEVEVDEGLVALIRALWFRGWSTTMSCQNLGESYEGLEKSGPHWDCWRELHLGYVWLRMPTPSALEFLQVVSASPAFAPRLKGAMDPGAWHVHSPVRPNDGGTFAVMDWVEVQFPEAQLDDLTRLIA
ncbi:hypothetical protein J4573_31480 [Actinomadura barringtoniae]|uniref:Uncharacterized protein n=1 Tax=Actinomadura barringtoniae TaxID=1427535 RepID=A0A939PKQ1_9ACTN|nr:hypothetical protein [Actinomadura barringtoniae]MBO2451649.1 hypothetical protein [Actinomadura barringtoniae]